VEQTAPLVMVFAIDSSALEEQTASLMAASAWPN